MINCVIAAPVDTYSGYGARSRDFVKALLKSRPDWNIQILPQRWGNTRFGYLKDHNENEIQSRIIPSLNRQPDVWIQITIPNEFQPIGKYNIGVTAGIETTMCAQPWIEGINRMDLTLVSSKHAKDIFKGTLYRILEHMGTPQERQVGEVSVQKPIEILFEGVDLTVYKEVPNEPLFNLESIEEDFAFLFVGHWLPGDFGHDRKNVGLLIKVFLDTFKNRQNKPALILKTQQVNSSITDQETILKRIDYIRKAVKGDLPNIYLISGDLKDEDINRLYNHPKVKAMVSLTKGEGFGRPLLEFSVLNKPIIASEWSGHLDFLSTEFIYPVKGGLHNVHPSAASKDMILEQSQWFGADPKSASEGLRAVYENYEKYREKSRRQGYRSRSHYSFNKMVEELDSLLTQYIPKMATEVELKLPELGSLPKL